MKKIGVLAVALTMAAGVQAQEFYVRAGLGYAFPQAGQTMDANGTPYNGTYSATTYTSDYKMKSASFSSGSNAVVGLGYFFNEHVGVALDAAVNLSGTKYTFTNQDVNYSTVTESLEQRVKTGFMLLPSLTLQTGSDSKWNLYARVGLAVPVSTRITQDDIYNVPYGVGQNQVQDYTFVEKNSFSLGFTGAAGVTYQVNDKMKVWGEVSFLSLSQYIKEADLKALTVDGYSYPLDSAGIPHVVKYSKNVTVDSNSTKQPAYSQPFSNVGFKIGISYTISKHEHSKGRRNDDELIDRTKPFKRHN